MQWPIGLIKQSILKQNRLKSQLVVIDLILPFGMRTYHIWFYIGFVRNAMAHRSYKAGPLRGVRQSTFPFKYQLKSGLGCRKIGSKETLYKSTM